MAGNGNGSRVAVRGRFTVSARLKLLENDVDKMESAFRQGFDELRSDMRRIFWAVATLATTIIAGLVVAVATK